MKDNKILYSVYYSPLCLFLCMHTALYRALCTTHCTNGSLTTQSTRNAWRKAKLQVRMPDLPNSTPHDFLHSSSRAPTLYLSSEYDTLLSMHRNPPLFNALRSPRADVPVARASTCFLSSPSQRSRWLSSTRQATPNVSDCAASPAWLSRQPSSSSWRASAQTKHDVPSRRRIERGRADTCTARR